MKHPQKYKADWIAAVFLSLCSGADGQAPITFDGSIDGSVRGNNQMRIQGGLLSADGLNLFHNFSRFNVPENTSAVFRNDAVGIRNVIARVTGSERSVISGDLSTQLGPDRMGRARVYLLNPNGVLFNGNSSIDLNALTVSTARTIGFDEGARVTFDSTPGDLANVTGEPVYFSELDGSGTVQFDGARLAMTNGGDLLLIAKDVELKDRSRVTTEGAQVLVAGAGAGNSVTFDVRDRSRLPTLGRPATGSVNIEGFSGISASDESAGRIVIRGGALTMINSNPNSAALEVSNSGGNPGVGIDLEASRSLTLTRGQITTGSSLEGTASDIRIRAPMILMDNDVAGINESIIRTSGRGGDIGIVTTSLTIRDGEISTNVKGGGTGGAMNITADQLTITDRSSIQSVAETSGNGGDIGVRIAGDLHIDGNGATRIDGDGTRILETVGITANTLGTGQGGEILVDVGGDLTIMNGGLIDSTTFFDGSAGAIKVNASNLTIDGENFDFSTGITAFTVNQTSLTAGVGGDIEVNVPGAISIVNGGEIDTSSFGAGDAGLVLINEQSPDATGSIVIDKGTATRFTGIGSDASGSGDAGEVRVRTNSLSISNGGLISTGVFYQPEDDGMGNTIPVNAGTGRGGDVRVYTNSLKIAGSSLAMDDGTSIVSNSAIYTGTQAGSSGEGGNIFIVSASASGSPPSIQLSNGAEIGAGTEGAGRGGSVTINNSGGQVALDSDTSISAQSGGMGGDAGFVRVEAERITLQNNSSISSTNQGDPTIGGTAGDVTLVTDYLTLNNSRLEVSAKGGDAGTISIDGARLQDIRSSEIVAEAFANGGNIVVRNSTALLLDNSIVSANAETGDGGIVDIESTVFFSQNSQISADSEFGNDGTVEINQAVTLTGAEGQLEISALDATDLIQPECTKRLDTAAGSFILSGRGGSARLPGGYLPSVRLHPTP